MTITKIAGKIRHTFLPAKNQKELYRWYSDGGDDKLRFDYNLTPSSLVMDLGGYEGRWTSEIYSRYRCQVYIFEPVSGYVEKIRKRFARNPDISVLQFGLGGITRTENIGISNDGSSIFRQSKHTEQIQIVDIAEWISSQKINEIDLMKVNIEGGEYELIERLIETGLIRIISSMQVQFHEISKQSSSRMEKIQDLLRETHHPTYQYRFVWENWERNHV